MIHSSRPFSQRHTPTANTTLNLSAPPVPFFFQVAAELFDFGQEALFLPEDMQDAAEKVFQTAKDLNPIFESCQIILGEVQDRKCRRQRLVYV